MTTRRTTRTFVDLLGAAALALLACAAPARGVTVWTPEAGFVDLDAPMPETARGFFGRAAALAAQGDVRAAEELLRRGLARFGADPLAGRMAFALARCEARLGRARDAFERCSRLLDAPAEGLSAEDVRALRLDIARGLAVSDPEAAVPLLRVIAGAGAEEARAADALRDLGRVQMRLGRYADARAAFAALAARFPQAPLALPARFESALATLRQARAEDDPGRLAEAVAEFDAFLDAPGVSAEEAGLARLYRWAARNAAEGKSAPERRAFYGVTWYLDGDAPAAYRACGKALADLKFGVAEEVALFYRARARQAMGKPWQAYNLFRDLMEKYPGSRYRRDVIDAEYEIAVALLAEKSGKATAVLDDVIGQDPLGPRAADAEMLRGNWFYAREKSEAALEAFGSILDNHSRSRHVSEALFKLGVCRLRQARHYDNVQDLLEEARHYLSSYVAEYPHGPFAADARRSIGEAEERLASLMWDAAALYERTGHPAAFQLYCERLARAYPATSWRRKADQALAAMKEKGDAR